MRIPKWLFVAAPIGFAVFIGVGGWVVMSLWNWLAPTLFGLHAVTFWQALGLLLLCRILFGGFGMGGGGGHRSGSRRKMGERWEQMTPEERERFKQSWRGRMGFCSTSSESTENKAQ
jgi:hypothetical protein